MQQNFLLHIVGMSVPRTRYGIYPIIPGSPAGHMVRNAHIEGAAYIERVCCALQQTLHTQPSATTISLTFRPGFRRQVKSMAQKLLNTSRLRPR